MARITPTVGVDLEDDKLYVGTLHSKPKIEKSTNPQYPDDRLVVDWALNMDGGTVRDWLSLKLGVNATNGQPSKLRSMLNAIAEKPKDAELWFDPETLEWGYDLDGDDTTPAYAKLTPGLQVTFKGENRKKSNGGSRYAITGYKTPAKRQPKLVAADAEPVDVDPNEIPF